MHLTKHFRFLTKSLKVNPHIEEQRSKTAEAPHVTVNQVPVLH